MPEVRVIPLGGAGEIGKNCTLVSQGDDLLMVDCGLSFPNEEQFGVDIVVPDFSYLIERRGNLKGIFLTHAHEDHVGAITHLLPHVAAPVYATEFTAAMVRSKMLDKAPGLEIDLRVVSHGDIVPVGSMSGEFVSVTHSIPDTSSVAVRTDLGIVLFTTDFKFDPTPVDGKTTDLARFAELGREGVLALLSDSTNVDRSGWGPSESIVKEGLIEQFERAPGRVLLTTFASNVHRMQQVFHAAHETGRKVAVAGRRMETVLDIAGRLKAVKIPLGVRIPLEDIDDLPDEDVVVLITGSQGESNAALSRMARKEYGPMQLKAGDTLLYAARPIPGNEAAIWRTVNGLFSMGARVVYDGAPIHVSGHGYQEELKMMVQLTQPKYLAPVHGEPRHQVQYCDMASQMGYRDRELFLIDNGSQLVFEESSAWLDDPIDAGEVLLDQQGGSIIAEQTVRDRHRLGHDGVVVVTLAVDLRAGEVVRRPSATARGFSGSEESLLEAEDAVVRELARLQPSELKRKDYLEARIADAARKAVSRIARQRPLVIGAVVDVPN